jgi:hypothetical protein
VSDSDAALKVEGPPRALDAELLDPGLLDPGADLLDAEVEEVDALIVLEEPTSPTVAGNPAVVSAADEPTASLVPARSGLLVPAVQAAAVAATGFAAGAAVVGIARRRSRAQGRPTRRFGLRREAAPDTRVVQVVSTRSLLVDVHVLGAQE